MSIVVRIDVELAKRKMVVMRALLRQATALRTDMDGVI